MRCLLLKSVVGSVLVTILANPAWAAGPFAEFDGVYKGAGRVSDIHGKSEPLTCKANNKPAPDGVAMAMSLVCASDSYRVDFHADLYTDGSALRGKWTEKSRSADGNVSGTLQPNTINAKADAPGFTADIVVHVVKAGRLDVTLNAKGTSIDHVEVSMKR